MILTCPACGTKYAVKDGAIPAGGRQVRCASCKHSWHQDPEHGGSTAEAIGAQEDLQSPAAAKSDVEDHPSAGAAGDLPDTGLGDHAHPDLAGEEFDRSDDPDGHPLPEPGAWQEVAASQPQQLPLAEEGAVDADAAHHRSGHSSVLPPEVEPILGNEEPVGAPSQDYSEQPYPAEQEEFSAYASAEEPEPSRRRGLVGLLLALLLIAAAVVAFWFLAPAEWKQRLGIAQASGSPVMVQLDETNRRTLASGNELLEVTGKVINPTDQPQRVPQMEAMLRTYNQKVVYRWTIPPPAPVLAPGGSATFNSAELLTVPADAACLSVLAREASQAKLEPCTPASQQVAAQPS